MRKSGKSLKVLAAIAAAAVLCAVLFAVFRTGNEKTEETPQEVDTLTVVRFDADSAYAHIEAQCAFGPRVPNTEAHKLCGQYIVSRFKALGLAVTEQKMELKAYDGTKLECMNIFASTDTTAKKRILISAHWDSRPWADNDPDENNHKKPVLAANDGASGVAVMLELARAFMEDKPSVGVDFVCFDAEDYGVAQWDESNYPGDMSNSWCLGSQYFAANLPFADYRPAYAVNLDMVGGKGAQFYQEGFSARLAPGIISKVWDAAERAGYGSMFPRQPGGYVTDDHLPLIRIAGIPAITVIPYYPNYAGSSFGPTWHTVNDTPANIDRNTLEAVGQTMLELIYSELLTI